MYLHCRCLLYFFHLLFIRFSPLEILLSSHNYDNFVPLVNILQIDQADALFYFLGETIDDAENIVENDLAVKKALQAVKLQLGIVHNGNCSCNSDDENDVGTSPAVILRKRRCKDIQDFYDQNKEKVGKAAREIILHSDARNLYYTLSARTEPDPKPNRIIQDMV